MDGLEASLAGVESLALIGAFIIVAVLFVDYVISAKKNEQDEFVEEAIKRVRFKISPEFAKSGGIKKIKVNDSIINIEIPVGTVNNQKVYVPNYNSEGDDLEVSLIVTE